MKYGSWQYLYPPRPDCAISPETLTLYENMGWIAQFKKNGTCTIIGKSPKNEFVAKNRHGITNKEPDGQNHKTWQLTQHIKDNLIRLFPVKGWIVLVAEIMHSKAPTIANIKDTIYIHDIVVYAGNYLVGSPFKERQDILDKHLLTNVEAKTHYICDSEGKIWYAKRFDKGFKELFWSIKEPKIDEGLVLKDPKGKLSYCSREDSNRSWQVKCRHSTKNILF